MTTIGKSSENVSGLSKIVVLDAGGQYCHLIARKVRELGVYAEIKPCNTHVKSLKDYKGIIISGGPASVNAVTRPEVDEKLFNLNIPVLGICYGHQIMTKALGGKVRKGKQGEYGIAELKVSTKNSLFKDIAKSQQVWMSHRDVVQKVPRGFQTIASTQDCEVAAMANFGTKQYGLQFHPEVVHTEKGKEILTNFAFDISGCKKGDWNPKERIPELVSQIRKTVGKTRNVFFLVSGGVDSTVAFTLCVKALGKDRVRGLYIDTGFMRKYDTEAIRHLVKSGMDNIHIENAHDEFMTMLRSTWNPEEKRKKIGKKFLEFTEHIIDNKLELNKEDWVLGQGTIYPDTIESGETENASHIKTHHNRVSVIRKLIAEGKIVEPLRDLYKDEVREVGLKLMESFNIPASLIFRHPFPGPGLAIRCLVSRETIPVETDSIAHEIASSNNLNSAKLPIRTVGVKGDERSYDSAILLIGRIPSPGKEKTEDLASISTDITNNDIAINRVIYCLSHKELILQEWEIKKAFITPKRTELLRDADAIVAAFMESRNLTSSVWQFPVVLIPFGKKTSNGETIVLRPVNSVDGMTAHYSPLNITVLRTMAKQIRGELQGIDAVVIDVTNKPPATIEWE